MEKNKDDMSTNIIRSISKFNPQIFQIFNFRNENLFDSSVKKNPKQKYLGYQFRIDMNNLYQQLLISNCHFIRCLKPNEQKQKDLWVASLALMQIRYMGILDYIKFKK